MITDIIYYSTAFYLDLPVYSSGIVAFIEPQTDYYLVRLSMPERISISLSQTSAQSIINR